jgi:ribonuclease E
VIDEPQHAAEEEVAPRHTEALEKEHEPKPHA